MSYFSVKETAAEISIRAKINFKLLTVVAYFHNVKLLVYSAYDCRIWGISFLACLFKPKNKIKMFLRAEKYSICIIIISLTWYKCGKKTGLYTGTGSFMWPGWPGHLKKFRPQVAQKSSLSFGPLKKKKHAELCL